MRFGWVTKGIATLAVAATAQAQSGSPPPSAVRDMPAPTGAQPVGTRVTMIVDTARHFAGARDSGRPVMVQAWYPAAGARGDRTPYLVEPRLAAVLDSTGYYGADSATIARWAVMRTHSHRDASIAAGRYPLVLFSVGLGVIRANYTSIAEELASRGFIVALVESPGAGLFVRPDGRLVTDTTNDLEQPDRHSRAVGEWASDVSFALDQLASGRGALGELKAAVDWSHLGAAGHSSGGLVALTVCSRDRRVQACIDMDGGMFAPDGASIAAVGDSGVRKPSLLVRSAPVYSDADLARRGLTRAQWEARGKVDTASFNGFLRRSTAPFWIARLEGTGHFSFSDAPFVLPTALSRFGGTYIPPDRNRLIIADLIETFIRQRGNLSNDIAQPALARYPELQLGRAGDGAGRSPTAAAPP